MLPEHNRVEAFLSPADLHHHGRDGDVANVRNSKRTYRAPNRVGMGSAPIQWRIGQTQALGSDRLVTADQVCHTVHVNLLRVLRDLADKALQNGRYAGN